MCFNSKREANGSPGHPIGNSCERGGDKVRSRRLPHKFQVKAAVTASLSKSKAAEEHFRLSLVELLSTGLATEIQTDRRKVGHV